MKRALFDSILLQVVAAVCLTAVSVYSYGKLFPPPELVTVDLKQIEGEYGLRFEGKCFGVVSLKSELTDELTSLSLNGTIRLKQRHEVILAVLNGETSFNTLGQFGGAFVTATFPAQSIRFGALGIDPIEVMFRLFSGETKTYEKKFQIPGPFIAKRAEGSKLSFEYRGMRNTSFSLPKVGVTVEKGSVSDCGSGSVEPERIIRGISSALPQLPVSLDTLLGNPT